MEVGGSIQKGSPLHQQAAQTEPGSSAKPESECRKTESQTCRTRSRELRLPSPLPLFYRQDIEDKCKWKTKAFTLGHYSGNFHLCLVTWAGSTQPWNPHPVPK